MNRRRRRDAVSGSLKIDLAVTGSEVTTAQRERVSERVLLALGRFGPGVERVTVRLSDVANALGSFDTRCEMRAWLRPRGSVTVETVDGLSAIDRAAVRLAARVEWALVDGEAELAARAGLPAPVARAPRREARARGPLAAGRAKRRT